MSIKPTTVTANQANHLKQEVARLVDSISTPTQGFKAPVIDKRQVAAQLEANKADPATSEYVNSLVRVIAGASDYAAGNLVNEVTSEITGVISDSTLEAATRRTMLDPVLINKFVLAAASND
jgi:hypothetical protein